MKNHFIGGYNMKKFITLMFLVVMVGVLSGCGPIQYSDLNRALTPDNIVYPDRESYIKALGLDKNPENPVTTLTVLPYNKEVELNAWVWTPFITNKKGDMELCIAKALKQVIPNCAVYFEIKPESIAVYKVERVFMSGDVALIRRSKLTSGKCSWFTEIYGKLSLKKQNYRT